MKKRVVLTLAIDGRERRFAFNAELMRLSPNVTPPEIDDTLPHFIINELPGVLGEYTLIESPAEIVEITKESVSRD